AAINGVPVEAHLGRSVREVLPDLADRVEPVFHAVLHRGEVCRDVEISGRTPADPDAERTWVSDYYPVVEDGRPRAIGMIVREITELRRSERARRQGDERLRLTLERAPVAVYTCDLDLRYTWEAGAEAQAPFAHAIGRFDHELLPAQQAAELIALKRKALIDGQPVRGELTLPAASGASRTWELAIEPARDGSGAVAGLLMAGLEITERKRAEEQKLLLLGELNHRVKNTLTAVRSMVMRTLAGPEEHEPLRETLVGRLQALARTHDLLAASGWQGAPLTALIEGELAPYRAPGSDRVDADGPAVTLASGTVSILALAVHELTANAARHGALSVPGGRVSLRWQVEPAAGGRGEVLHITWREAGGPPVRESASSGFGRQLIERGVTYEIGGRSETRLDPAGFCWEAWLPVERCLRPEG
ncbi:MAG TPA: PAS domain-containing protein, partial [Geminicoccaceae bacterium]